MTLQDYLTAIGSDGISYLLSLAVAAVGSFVRMVLP
jgi:hypothetical protein